MPYEIIKDGHKWDVVNKETGESKGSSESQEAAVAHMRALSANEPKGYADGGIVQPEVVEQPSQTAQPDYMGEINNYFAKQKADMSKYDADKQKAVADYVMNQQKGWGNTIGQTVAGIGDAVGMASGQNPGFMKRMQDQDQRELENVTSLGKSMNDQNMEKVKAGMSLDAMNTGNPLGASEASAHRPLLEKLFPGKSAEEYARIEANPKALESIFGPSVNLARANANNPFTVSWETANPQEQATAKALVEGRIRASDLGLRARGRIVSLAEEYAQAEGLPFQSYGGDVKAGMAKDLAYGKMGKNALSLNTALGHASDAMKAFDAVKNTDVKYLNVPINKLKAQTNDPNIVALGLNLNALRGELANVFKGSGATDQEIASWEKYLNEDLTPAQYKAAGEKIMELLNSRLDAMKYQQGDVMGKSASERTLISPKGEKIMHDLEGGKGGIVEIHNQQDYDKLPKGAQYISNGKTYRKK